MCFLFQRCDDLVETLDIGSANSMDNGVFQCRQMLLNAVRQFSSFCRWAHYKCTAICFAHCPRNQSTFRQTIENTG